MTNPFVAEQKAAQANRLAASARARYADRMYSTLAQAARREIDVTFAARALLAEIGAAEAEARDACNLWEGVR